MRREAAPYAETRVHPEQREAMHSEATLVASVEGGEAPVVLDDGGRRERRPRGWEVTGFLVQMAVNALVVTSFGWTALGYLLLSTYFAYGPHPIAGHFVHEHYLLSGEQETHSYYGPLNALTLNMGFHNEHHDFVGIPGTRLPELHRIARNHYGSLASHRSWTAVLWIFLRERRLGHHSRIVRSLDVFRAATQVERERRAKLAADRLSFRPPDDSNALASS